jgi:hypothetical protein
MHTVSKMCSAASITSTNGNTSDTAASAIAASAIADTTTVEVNDKNYGDDDNFNSNTTNDNNSCLFVDSMLAQSDRGQCQPTPLLSIDDSASSPLGGAALLKRSSTSLLSKSSSETITSIGNSGGSKAGGITSSMSSSKMQQKRLGAPPADLLPEYELVMEQLYTLWGCEIDSFETIQGLAQILLHREATWEALQFYEKQATSEFVTVSESDLFDVPL